MKILFCVSILLVMALIGLVFIYTKEKRKLDNQNNLRETAKENTEMREDPNCSDPDLQGPKVQAAADLGTGAPESSWICPHCETINPKGLKQCVACACMAE